MTVSLNYGHVCFPPQTNENWTCSCGTRFYAIHEIEVAVSEEVARHVTVALADYLLNQNRRVSDYAERVLWELQKSFNAVAYPKDNQ